VLVEEGASSVSAALQRSPIFSKLNGEARSLLNQAMTEHIARKGEIICSENSPCHQIGVVLEGAVAVFVGAGTRERLLFHLYPFDLFGDVEYFDRGLAVGRTIVLSKNARYATVAYDAIERIGMRDPAFLTSLAAGVSQHARTLASALAAQVSKPILARVAGALLPYAAPERTLHPALSPLPTMTQAQVAAAAGTVKEVAARAIAELERVQALRRERGHIRYLDRVKLLEVIDQS
jgi:signal-transduction protein with cAMP-binding, CBS, and nucleotidyltransferase domain